jgi:catechol 2,3-dioxygenase-like lactoylglutathione lyase family enzyme
MRLDHVNIRTVRLADSIAFYGELLGFAVVPPPMTTDMTKGAYVQDGDGHPVVHLVASEAVPDAPGPVLGKAMRGMVDHVALRCEDAAAYEARLERSGLAYTTMDVPQIASRLIFVRDPNEVMIELSFPLAS